MMKRQMLHIAFFFFTLTALTGVWLRLYVFSDAVKITDYPYILHGHSHIAVLGWTFFSAFLLLVFFLGQASSNSVSVLIGLLVVVTIPMFVAFLIQGYALYSIIFSTLHIFVQYLVVYFVIKHTRKNDAVPGVIRRFIYGAIVMLIISSIGPFALGAIAANGLRNEPVFDMAVYFYLHFQYNGWLTLILFGLFLFILERKSIAYREKWFTYSFWIYTISLFPGYFLSVLWHDFGSFGQLAAIIGAIGQLVGVSFFIAGILQLRGPFKRNVSPFVRFHVHAVLLLLFVKSVLELGLLYPPLANLVYETRSIVVGYLHLTLLGFISLFFITQFLLIGLLHENGLIKVGAAIFFVGFIVNELVLFLSGLYTWLGYGSLPLNQELLLLASILLLAGIVAVWGSVTVKKA